MIFPDDDFIAVSAYSHSSYLPSTKPCISNLHCVQLLTSHFGDRFNFLDFSLSADNFPIISSSHFSFQKDESVSTAEPLQLLCGGEMGTVTISVMPVVSTIK